MQQGVSTARPDELVEEVLARLPDGDPGVLPVLDQGRLVGLFTAENLGEYLMIQSALGRDEGRANPGAGKEG
jgi:CBS domain-containing protein